MGGYLAGRLRTKWANIHTDEVYFRDTAHGFLAWAVALVITAAFLASAATSMAGATASSGEGTGSARAAQAEGRESTPGEYLIDTLFRSDRTTPDSNSASVRGEAGRILANSLRQREVSAEDKTYLDNLIAARTGISQTDADKRVSDVFARAQQTAEMARKTVAHSLLWIFLALLIGAFCASCAATIGGRQRDHVVIV
jgi:small-conductance mechanosensitive channel